MQNNKYSFYAYLSRMKYINRWGLMRNTLNENIEGHSYQVALLAHGIAVVGNKYFNRNYDEGRAALMGMFHDCSEIITGDMPTPVKYFNPNIQDAYKKVEKIANDKLSSMLPEEMRGCFTDFLNENDKDLYPVVKAADKLSAYIKCIEEIKSGNKEFTTARKTVKEALDSMNMPELDKFMDMFIPAFELTLDEL